MEATNINEVIANVRSHFPKPSNFGIWFRGQSNYSHTLVPSIFRQGAHYRNIEYSEMGMYREFLLLKECQRRGPLSAFEWLTLMQHYNLPTRLLDWSSNLLIALFFSCYDKESDGSLFILDPIEFNRESDPWSGRTMNDYLNTQVIIRANLARVNNLKGFLKINEVKKILNDTSNNIEILNNSANNLDELDNPWWQRTIQTPIAVTPAQQNDRLFLQQGKFTIHGGKIVDGETIISIISIEELAKSSLIKIKIPRTAKENIKEELKYCGISGATIFPELEYQSIQIKKNWTT